MNHAEYIFGNLLHGYSQYPDDYTRAIFTDSDYVLNANSQIVIHREDSLLYYNYYRKLESSSDRFIGLSVCFNGLYFKDIKKLFNVFEQIIAEMAVSGRIIEFADTGSVIAKAGMLYLEEAEIKRVTKSLRLSIEALENQSFAELPPVNYAIDKKELAKFSLKGINSQQKKSLSTVNRLVVYKDEDYNTTQLTGYAQKLASLNSRNEALLSQNAELQEKVDKLTKQKKQYRVVIALVFILLACLVGIYFFNKNIQSLEADLATKREAISELQEDVNEKTTQIKDLSSTVTSQRGTITELNNQLRNKNNTCDSLLLVVSSLSTEVEEYKVSVSSLNDKVFNLTKKNESLSSELSSTRSSMAKLPPLLIESVKMGSEQDKWTTINIKPGERLASYKVKYLFPEISYYGLRLETVNLIYKIYDSSGNIHCTCETEVSLSKGSSSHQLTAYGSNSGGSWKAGTYRIDIWYKSTLLYSKNFTIESS